jgi:mono/diheme cytochrome c family protein
MPSKTFKVAALALVSLGAACTSSELGPGMAGRTGAAGSTDAPASMPFVPFSPTASSTPALPIPTGAAGAGGMTATGTGGAATVSAPSACGAAMGPLPGGTSPFLLDISGAVTSLAVPPRPITGGTLLVLHDGSAAVASDPDRDRLFVVDLVTRAVRATVLLPPGDEPGRLVEDAKGLIHVALRRGGAVVTLDPTLGIIVAREAICAAPRGLAYEPSTDLVHVACAEGLLVSLRAAGGVIRSLNVTRDLRDVVALADGRLVVSTFRRADALVLDGAGKVTASLRPATSARMDLTGLQTLSPSVAWRMVARGATGAIMLHQRALDGPVAPVPGGYAGGKGCGGIVESAVTVVDPAGQMGAASPAFQFATVAVDVALSPDGSQLAVASPGNAHTPLPQLMVTSLSTVITNGNGGGCVSAGLPTVAGPDGPGAGVDGQPPGQVIAVSFASNGTIVTQSREPAALWTSDGKGTITLPAESTADTGHMLFHANSGSGIACASCHPEGGDDGRVWNFACLGPRRTQSLRGGLSGTEPFHWDGDMKDFPKLVNDVFVGRMAGPAPSDAQSAAMLHWLDSVPELPNPPPAEPAAVARGRAIFNGAAGCATCHSGEHFTNNLSVDVGTAQGLALQVPSLRGVGWRAPFLHDGCAPTLADRFGSCGGGDKHGHTAQLLPANVSDLIAYLESL